MVFNIGGRAGNPDDATGRGGQRAEQLAVNVSSRTGLAIPPAKPNGFFNRCPDVFVWVHRFILLTASPAMLHRRGERREPDAEPGPTPTVDASADYLNRCNVTGRDF